MKIENNIQWINAIFLIFILLIALFFGCASGTKKFSKESDCQATRDPGWENSDTFILSAIGFASNNRKGFVARRTQSKSAAILCAQKAAFYLLTKDKEEIELSQKQLEDIKIPSKFSGSIRGGMVIAEKYDENDACKIKFQVKENNFRSRFQ